MQQRSLSESEERLRLLPREGSVNFRPENILRRVAERRKKRLPINKKRPRIVAAFSMRIGSITDLAPGWIAVSHLLCPSLFLLFSFLPLAGLSFVKLDSLAPSLRAITLDYFCLQSCTPSYIRLRK